MVPILQSCQYGPTLRSNITVIKIEDAMFPQATICPRSVIEQSVAGALRTGMSNLTFMCCFFVTLTLPLNLLSFLVHSL